MRDYRVEAVVLGSGRSETRSDQWRLSVIVAPVHVRSRVHESLNRLQPGHASCKVQCCMTLFVKEDIVVHLARIIGRVLTQEVEHCGGIIGPVDEVNDGDLARVRQRRPEVRKLLGGDPGIEPGAVGLEIHRPVD